MASTNDYFSEQSNWYAQYRPTYPEPLYQEIVSHVRNKAVAWDCATGNGQCAARLAKDFTRVVATDKSWDQLAKAAPASNIHYMLAAAEQTPFVSNTFDLITVAQALHWFNTNAFFEEVRRVGKPGGIIACWGYGEAFTASPADEVIQLFYHQILKGFWPPERKHIDTAYQEIAFPFQQVNTDVSQLHIEKHYSFYDLLGYFQSWSAVKQFQQQKQQNPVDLIRDSLREKWENPNLKKAVKWPLFIKIGTIEK